MKVIALINIKGGIHRLNFNPNMECIYQKTTVHFEKMERS
jgi:hypothetical protein